LDLGTSERETAGLKAAFTELSELFSATADETDAFSLAGYIEDVQKGEKALPEKDIREEAKRRRKKLPKDSDYRAVLTAFPEPRLARKIFGTMENARIDNHRRQTYRGLLYGWIIQNKRPHSDWSLV